MTRPKWSKEKDRVVRAAMRWYHVTENGTVKNWPQRVNSYDELRKACAAASKRRKKT